MNRLLNIKPNNHKRSNMTNILKKSPKVKTPDWLLEAMDESAFKEERKRQESVGRLYDQALLKMMLEWQSEDLNPCNHIESFTKAVREEFHNNLITTNP